MDQPLFSTNVPSKLRFPTHVYRLDTCYMLISTDLVHRKYVVDDSLSATDLWSAISPLAIRIFDLIFDELILGEFYSDEIINGIKPFPCSDRE